MDVPQHRQAAHLIDDSDDSNDSNEEHVILAAFVLLGAEEAMDLCRRRRNVTRHYLTRPQLIPNPRAGTPWQVLFASQNDQAFIKKVGNVGVVFAGK